MKKIYEIECQRSNVTPKEFFRYCKKQLAAKNVEIEIWVENYEDWANPMTNCHLENNHEDWEIPCKEICAYKPLEMQLFLANAYNFIMEFDFWDEKKGSGYLYAVEFER